MGIDLIVNKPKFLGRVQPKQIYHLSSASSFSFSPILTSENNAITNFEWKKVRSMFIIYVYRLASSLNFAIFIYIEPIWFKDVS